MSEVCEICAALGKQCAELERDRDRNAALWEEQRARADRYEAEFAACKALLVAAQQRAERAEAERAEAEAKAVAVHEALHEARKVQHDFPPDETIAPRIHPRALRETRNEKA